MPIPLIVAGIGAAVAGVVAAIGGAVAAGDLAKAQRLREEALAEYGAEVAPVLDNILAQEIGESEFAKLTENQGLRDTQQGVLDELGSVYENEGRTQADKAAEQVAQNAVNLRASGDIANYQQAMERQGQAANPALAAAAAALTACSVF